MNINEWTEEDQEKALSQGWGIFQNMDSKALEIQKNYTKILEIQRNDEYALIREGVHFFETDEDAFYYVRTMALDKRPLYIKAMEIIAKPIPFANFETFMEEAVANIAPPIGLMPKPIWMKLRLKDIKEAGELVSKLEDLE